jgi:hypothetical protein
MYKTPKNGRMPIPKNGKIKQTSANPIKSATEKDSLFLVLLFFSSLLESLLI